MTDYRAKFNGKNRLLSRRIETAANPENCLKQEIDRTKKRRLNYSRIKAENLIYHYRLHCQKYLELKKYTFDTLPKDFESIYEITFLEQPVSMDSELLESITEEWRRRIKPEKTFPEYSRDDL